LTGRTPFFFDRERGYFHFMKTTPCKVASRRIGAISTSAQPCLKERFVRRKVAFGGALPEPTRVASVQFALEIGGALVRYHAPCPWQELRAVIQFR
jgi:hypothetical protein